MIQQVKDEITPDLRKYAGQAMQRTIRNAFRRGANRIGADAKKRFRGRGVGRIWAKRVKGLPISVGRARITEGSAEIDITAKGLAALQETGGRTKPHAIKPRSVKALAFSAGGKHVFARSVRHPGSQIARIPSVDQALDAGAGKVMDEIERAVDALMAG